MGMVLERRYKFADRVIADGKKGTVIEANDKGLTIQFVKGKTKILWSELLNNPERIRPA